MGCGSSHTVELNVAAPPKGDYGKHTPQLPKWHEQMPPKLRSQLSDDDWDSFVRGALQSRIGYQWRTTSWKSADLGKVVQLVVKDFEQVATTSDILKKGNVDLKVQTKKLKDDKELGEMYNIKLTLFMK